MEIFFVFSDECGLYRQERTDKFVWKNPYFCRTALIINAKDWQRLKVQFENIKAKYGIPYNKEVKWSYIWSLKRDRRGGEIKKEKPYYFLKDYSEEQLLDYIEECLGLLTSCNQCKIIYTVTLNDPHKTPRINEASIYEMHLQDIMQRVKMEMRANKNLAALFLDPAGERTDTLLREAYYSIYSKGDFINKYHHIKDSISFELSHHSFGIQLADYCVGIFNSTLKGFPASIELFKTKILSLIRKEYSRIFGYGIIEIPKKFSNRRYLKNLLIKMLKL